MLYHAVIGHDESGRRAGAARPRVAQAGLMGSRPSHTTISIYIYIWINTCYMYNIYIYIYIHTYSYLSNTGFLPT